MMSPGLDTHDHLWDKTSDLGNSSADNSTRWQKDTSTSNQMHAFYYIVAVVSFYMSSILLLLIKYIKFREPSRQTYLYQPLADKDGQEDRADDLRRADEQLIRAKSIPSFKRETRV